jgi:hypothetical protein
VWPKTYSLARAYLDQLERSKGLGAGKIALAREELAKAEKASGTTREVALNQLVSRLQADAKSALDAAKVRMLAGVVQELGTQRRLASGT